MEFIIKEKEKGKPIPGDFVSYGIFGSVFMVVDDEFVRSGGVNLEKNTFCMVCLSNGRFNIEPISSFKHYKKLKPENNEMTFVEE
jgi:hypothetical protein